jgi:hypothetical protein
MNTEEILEELKLSKYIQGFKAGVLFTNKVLEKDNQTISIETPTDKQLEKLYKA